MTLDFEFEDLDYLNELLKRRHGVLNADLTWAVKQGCSPVGIMTIRRELEYVTQLLNEIQLAMA